MDYIILSIVLSFTIVFFAIPIIIQIAKEKKLFDQPEERKIHKMVIPTLGGLGIFAGFIMSLLLSVPQSGNNSLQYFIAAFVIIFFLGIKDDLLIISASKKFVGQVVAAIILIKFAGIQINNMNGLFGIYQIPESASFLLSLFTIVVITNSFNLIDGIDGLAGSIGVLSTIIFGSYFYTIGEQFFAIMAFALTGSLMGFLIYNFAPAKIFMGDTGSLIVGIINSILVIKFISVSLTPGVALPVSAAPAIGFAILILPLFDTLRVFAIRIFSGRSPFSPDRNHIHHKILDLGLSHKQTTFVCLSANIFIVLFSFFIKQIGTTYLLGSILMLCVAFIGIIEFVKKSKLNKAEETRVKTEPFSKSESYLSFTKDTIEII